MRFSRFAVYLSLVLVAAGCGKTIPPDLDPRFAQAIPCPIERSVAPVVRTIGPGGGVIEFEGHTFEVPAGAVRDSVRFSAAVLAGDILRLDIRANDRESFAFERGRPAILRLTYRPCPSPSNPQLLRIFKIDLESNRLLQGFRGPVDTGQLTVEAELPTLTGYTIGTFTAPAQDPGLQRPR